LGLFRPLEFINKNMKTIEQLIKDSFLNKRIKIKKLSADNEYTTGLVTEVLVHFGDFDDAEDMFEIELHHSNDELGRGLCTCIYKNTLIEII
jgi:hypothetical protein